MLSNTLIKKFEDDEFNDYNYIQGKQLIKLILILSLKIKLNMKFIL